MSATRKIGSQQKHPLLTLYPSPHDPLPSLEISVDNPHHVDVFHPPGNIFESVED